MGWIASCNKRRKTLPVDRRENENMYQSIEEMMRGREGVRRGRETMRETISDISDSTGPVRLSCASCISIINSMF